MAELILVGDRVLIEPLDGEQTTQSGLILPATAADKERVQMGRVVKVGPGYLVQNPRYSEEPWTQPKEAIRYLPMQAEAGDVAAFLRKEGFEFSYKGKVYLIVPHQALLALIRPDEKDLLQSLDSLLS